MGLLTFLILHVLPLVGAVGFAWLNLRRALQDNPPMSELGVRLLPQLLLGGVAVVWGVDGYQQLSGASLALVNLALFHVLPALLLIGLARPVVRWRLKANPSHAANPGRAELAYTLVAWVIAALIVAWGVANYLNAIDVS